MAGLGLWAIACNDRPLPFPADDGISVDGGPGGGGVGGIFVGTGASVGAGAASCVSGTGGSLVLLYEHGFTPWAPAYRELYAWISADEEAALRAGGPLLPSGNPETEGVSALVEDLWAWRVGHPDGLEQALDEDFERPLLTWPQPWPIRFASDGADVGDRLVGIHLAPDSYVATVAEHGEIYEVYDLDGGFIPLDQALQTPERIAVLYTSSLGEAANATCGPRDRVVTGDAYRRLLVGNPSRIESYELGTEALLNRLEANIEALTEYLEFSRPCPTVVFGGFENVVPCQWGYGYDPYFEALSTTAPIYEPTAANIADIIEALQDARFEVDSFYFPQP